MSKIFKSFSFKIFSSLEKLKNIISDTLYPYIHISIYCCLVTKLCLTLLLWSHGLQPTRLLCPGKNTRVSCYFLLQGIFSSQGANLHLLHWQVDSILLSPQGQGISMYSHNQIYVCVHMCIFNTSKHINMYMWIYAYI